MSEAATSNVNEAFFITVAKVAGAEQPLRKAFAFASGGFRNNREDSGTDNADLAVFARANLLARVVLDLHFHAGTVKSAGADARLRTVFRAMEGRRQHGDFPVTLTQPEILHQHRAELGECPFPDQRDTSGRRHR